MKASCQAIITHSRVEHSPSVTMPHRSDDGSEGKIDIFIDVRSLLEVRICYQLTASEQRGGTFTDCIGIPQAPGKDDIVVKLLSVDPLNYPDAPTEGIRRILEQFTGRPHPRDQKISTENIGVIRMGT